MTPLLVGHITGFLEPTLAYNYKEYSKQSYAYSENGSTFGYGYKETGRQSYNYSEDSNPFDYNYKQGNNNFSYVYQDSD